MPLECNAPPPRVRTGGDPLNGHAQVVDARADVMFSCHQEGFVPAPQIARDREKIAEKSLKGRRTTRSYSDGAVSPRASRPHAQPVGLLT